MKVERFDIKCNYKIDDKLDNDWNNNLNVLNNENL